MIPKMTWHVVQFKDVLPTPWRNGGGKTRELTAWPTPADWLWRASVADVEQTGPFSDFAGVQRWFAVLKGDGVCLTIDGRTHRLGSSDQPLLFDGAAQTDCELLGGATQDFNLMVKHGTTARMQRIFSRFETSFTAPKIIAACAYKYRATVQIGTEFHEILPQSFGWAHVQAHVAVHVQSRDVLWMEIDA